MPGRSEQLAVRSLHFSLEKDIHHLISLPRRGYRLVAWSDEKSFQATSGRHVCSIEYGEIIFNSIGAKPIE